MRYFLWRGSKVRIDVSQHMLWYKSFTIVKSFCRMSGALTKWSFYFLFYVNTIDNNFRCGIIFKKANCKVLDCLTYYCIWRWEDSYILLLILFRTNQWKTSSLSYTRYLQVHIVQFLYLLASSSYSNVIIYTTYNSGFSKKKVLLYTLQLIERAN